MKNMKKENIKGSVDDVNYVNDRSRSRQKFITSCQKTGLWRIAGRWFQS